MLKSFAEVRRAAAAHGGLTIAVPAAEDRETLEAVVEAQRHGIARSLLIGRPAVMRETLAGLSADPADFDLVSADDDTESARIAVSLAREGRASMVLKGMLSTPTLLKAALHPETGLRTGRLLSDVFVYEDPGWDDAGGRLVAITDGGITPLPDLRQKRQILENAVTVYHRLGNPCPKVAVMSATEKPSDKIVSTTDAVALAESNRRGEITGCLVDGPLALDVAMFRWCAEMKGVDSPVAGDTDIMLMPSFEAGNCTAKVFVFYLKRQIGHVIMGSRVPLLINSRTDDAAQKVNSIALSIIAGLPGRG